MKYNQPRTSVYIKAIAFKCTFLSFLLWSIMIIWLSIFIILNFYQKHYDLCHNQKGFFSKCQVIFGNENSKITSLEWFKFGMYLNIFVRVSGIYLNVLDYQCSDLKDWAFAQYIKSLFPLKVLLLGFIWNTKYLKLYKHFWLL